MLNRNRHNRPTRCVDGRTMRHDPQPDDPGLETDIGKCSECNGKGCDQDDGIPRVTDNDGGEIAVTLNGKEIRGWSYKDDAERRTKMLCAREYVEGWCDGREAI